MPFTPFYTFSIKIENDIKVNAYKESRVMNINGTKVFVEKIQGQGDLSFILLHNAGGNHHFFMYQIETLKKYGTVIQMDFPGHGESSNTLGYGIHQFASLVIEVCNQFSLKNICLIGLNYGANVAIDSALSNMIILKSIILIDPSIFMDDSFKNEIKMFIQKLEGVEFDSFVTELVSSLFIETDAQNKKIATKAFQDVDKQVLRALFKELIEWDAHSIGILKKIKCPTLCIMTNEYHCSYEKLKQEAPHFEIGKVIESKCWATLEVPDQINAKIERFLKITQSK